MTATSGADAAPTLGTEELVELRRTMRHIEPDWVHMTSALERSLSLVLGLVEGTVQGAEARGVLMEHRRNLEAWHTAADRYYLELERAGYPLLPEEPQSL